MQFVCFFKAKQLDQIGNYRGMIRSIFNLSIGDTLSSGLYFYTGNLPRLLTFLFTSARGSVFKRFLIPLQWDIVPTMRHCSLYSLYFFFLGMWHPTAVRSWLCFQLQLHWNHTQWDGEIKCVEAPEAWVTKKENHGRNSSFKCLPHFLWHITF